MLTLIYHTGNILLRLTIPPLFFVAAAPYFLPKTSHNVRQYLGKIEDAHFPEFASQHDELNRQLSSTFNSAKYHAEHLSDDVRGLSGKITHQIEDTTGLKLKDALNRANQVSTQVSSEFSQELEKQRATEASRYAAAVEEAKSLSQPQTVAIITEEIPVAEVVAISATPETPAQLETKPINAASAAVDTKVESAPIPPVAPAQEPSLQAKFEDGLKVLEAEAEKALKSVDDKVVEKKEAPVPAPQSKKRLV